MVSNSRTIRVALEQHCWTPSFEVNYENKRAEMALPASEFPPVRAIIAGFEGRFRGALPEANCYTVTSPLLGKGLSDDGWVLSEAFGRKTFGAAHVVFLAARQSGDSLLLRLYAVSNPVNTSALRGTLTAVASLFAFIMIFSVVLSWFTGQGLAEALSSGKLAQMSGDFSGLLLVGAAVVSGLGFGIPLCDLAGKAVFGAGEFLFERQLRRFKAWAEPLAVAQRVLDETIRSADVLEGGWEAHAPQRASADPEPDAPAHVSDKEPLVGMTAKVDHAVPIRLSGATELLNLTYLQTLGRFWLAFVLALGTPLFFLTFGKLLLKARGPLSSVVPKALVYGNAGWAYGVGALSFLGLTGLAHMLMIALGSPIGIEYLQEGPRTAVVLLHLILSSMVAVLVVRSALLKVAIKEGKVLCIPQGEPVRRKRLSPFLWVPAVYLLFVIGLTAMSLPRLPGEQLTRFGQMSHSPSVMPDGRILFVKNREICIMDSDGRNVRVLGEGDSPAGGPNGQIAFVSDRDGYMEIYVMGDKGQDVRRVTTLAEDMPREHEGARVECGSPSWAQDGRIVFESSYAATLRGEPFTGEKYSVMSVRDNAIWIIDPDGGNPRRLSPVPGRDSSPSWGPDGRIVFVSERDGGMGIYTFDSNGRNVSLLTYPKDYQAFRAAVARNGRIAFLSLDLEGGGVFCIDRDSGTVKKVLDQSELENIVHVDIALTSDGHLVFSAYDLRASTFGNPVMEIFFRRVP